MKNHCDYYSEDGIEFPPVDFNYITTANQLSNSSTSELQETTNDFKGIKFVDDQVSNKKWINKRAKVEKIVAKKYQRNIQPGECMKLLQVDFDKELSEFDFYHESQLLLKNANVKTQNISLIIPSCLNWIRFVEVNTIDRNNEINTMMREESQQDVMVIWNWDKTVKKIYNQSFQESLTDITTIITDKKLSLIIYRMEGYFSYHRDDSGKKKLEITYSNIDELPKISKKDFECSLVEAQITLNCNIILIENSQDMSSMILQHTKAIAEIPYKIAMRQPHVEGNFDFYAMGDNKNTIKVDGDGFGLRRLWLRQLCLFNNAGLATAEAICTTYSSPSQLMKSYEQYSAEKGKGLLKDIPIRRGPGELCTSRKIGSELSRKIYTMFTSTNGLQLLN
ncbi:crossover junction endonuclease EME1 [Diachasma alloeum]|uniref:crossover junction endonuclease EME1 n=1 Tax=Diachasma alloeum TaxID=454923 RepID=UPI0007384CB2|nr:crossover junction endonuclease EME1 [Diachasma alloeum]